MYITEKNIDILTELFTVGIGRGASLLNRMLNKRVVLQIPAIHLLKAEDVVTRTVPNPDIKQTLLNMNFKGDYTGKVTLIFSDESATCLMDKLTENMPGGAEMNVIRAAALTEVGNVVLNSVMGSISEALEIRFDYSVPRYDVARLKDLVDKNASKKGEYVLSIQVRFSVAELEIQGDVIVLFGSDRLQELIESTTSLYEACVR